jgi:hypothetical protein
MLQRTSPIPASPVPDKTIRSAFSMLARAANAVERELGDDESISIGDFIERVNAKLGSDGLAKLSAAYAKMWPVATTATVEAAE